MPGSRLRTSLVALGIVAVAAVSAYIISVTGPGGLSAAQPGGQPSVCWHVGVSDWQCPDSLFAVTRSDYVTGVSVTVETRDGKRATMRLPSGTDAIFLTRESTEKFLLSYYWATNKDKAMALTRKLEVIRDPAAK